MIICVPFVLVIQNPNTYICILTENINDGTLWEKSMSLKSRSV